MDPKALGQFLMQPSTADVLNTPVRRGGILPVTEYPNRTEFDLSSGLTGALMNAFTAPARAARGEISDAEMIPEAFNFAGSLTLGGLLSPKPANTVGIFGGRLARTADQAALAKAEQMAQSGAPREQIWNETGWFQGPDQKWRFEIDDSGARLTDWDKNKHGLSNIAWPEAARRQAGVDPMPTAMNYEDFLDHPELARAYWPTRDQGPSVFYNNSEYFNGRYNPTDDSIMMNNQTSLSPDKGRSTALHETQHAIQHREGFARGENLAEQERIAGNYMDIIQRYEGEAYANGLNAKIAKKAGDEAEFQRLNDARTNALNQLKAMKEKYEREFPEGPYGRYKRSAGEVEARTVQTRKDLTADERRARPPWLDYDVPEGDQIVRLANILAANAKTGAAVPLATKALESQQPQGIRAFHGSPHDFDRFDMSKIGTGEGAQAYGHGLYFAEAEDVARSYRDTLTKSGQDWGQRALDKAGGDVDAAISTIQSKIDRYRAGGADGYASAQEEVLRALNQYKETGSFSPGHMYEVNIKANPKDFLDWDKPLSQQSEKAREAALSAMERASGGITRNDLKEGVTGADVVRYGGLDDPNTMTKALRDAGIPGIRYLDQMSRGEGKGSSNYVVFDDSLIEILRKYGLLGPVAGGGTLAGMLMGGQDGETY